jgi:multicomponent Na+:H+ antiporter subunit D
MLLGTSVCLKLFLHVLDVGTVTYQLSGWAPPLGIELKVTVLSGFLSWLISLVALLAYLGGSYSWGAQVGERAPQFQALLFLLLASFQGLALTNDAFNMFVMLEVSSLSTYGLIAFVCSFRRCSFSASMFLATAITRQVAAFRQVSPWAPPSSCSRWLSGYSRP